jgi:hypothetical protein
MGEPPLGQKEMSYLRQLSDCSKYSDWTDDPAALAMCQKLEKLGFCRVVFGGDHEWDVYQSNEQLRRSIAVLEGATHGK